MTDQAIDRLFTKRRPPQPGWRLMMLTLVLYLLYSVDFWGLQLTPMTQASPLRVVMVALMHAAALSILGSGATGRGWPLMGALFLFLFGLSGLLPVVDAGLVAQFAPHLPPPARLHLDGTQFLVNSTVTALVVAPLTALAFNKWRPANFGQAGQILVDAGLPGRVLLLAVAGAMLALGLQFWLAPTLAGLAPAAISVELAGVLGLRALLWLALSLPALLMLPGVRVQITLLTAILYFLLLFSPQLLPADLDPVLQSAQAVGTASAALIFGGLVGWWVGQ